MAYRFLLEVPESLASEANIAVGAADDAQVVVVRNSHALDFDEPYVDLTVAAHSLRVIQTLYGWFDDLGGSRPDLRIVLHGGERLALEAVEHGDMVAAIRRDQPWVERTIPLIGEHEGESILPESEPSTGGPRAPRRVEAAPERSWNRVAPLAAAAGTIQFRALNHIAVRVTDLERAEAFYHDFFSMDIVGRARPTGAGLVETLDASYSWVVANAEANPATVTFLRNGPLVLAVQSLGRGARIERGVLDHVSLRVDASAFNALKGQVLMRSMEVLAAAETSIIFRDPFFMTWEITLQSLPTFIA